MKNNDIKKIIVEMLSVMYDKKDSEIISSDYISTSHMHLIKDLVGLIDETNNQKILTVILILLCTNLNNGSTALLLSKWRKNDTYSFYIKSFQKEISGVFKKIVGDETAYKPLVYDANNEILYFHKYYHAEKELNHIFEKRFMANPAIMPNKLVIQSIIDNTKLDKAQKIAMLISLFRMTSIITGGPGTGKTYTASYLISFFQQNYKYTYEGKEPKIVLAAPTGKAAKRLTEQIVARASDIGMNIQGLEGQTLHKLLEFSPSKQKFLRDSTYMLEADLVIVDEASMINMEIFRALLNALPDSTALVLIGDPNQLPSVGKGAVFSDMIISDEHAMCKELEESALDYATIQNYMEKTKAKGRESSICFLTAQQRSTDAILLLAEAIRNGQSATLDLKTVEHNDLEAFFESKETGAWHYAPRNRKEYKKLIQIYLNYYFNEQYVYNFQGTEINEQKLHNAHINKLLTVLREGGLGSEQINADLSNLYYQKYNSKQGTPLMITANLYDKGLFNGDSGVMIDEKHAFFSNKGSCAIKSIHSVTNAFAITVHKSQGSEYDSVVVILPDNIDNPLLTRELLYTGITRAKKKVLIVGSDEVLIKMIETKAMRESGLFR